MSNYVINLHKKNMLSCPTWLPNSIHYETITGSLAYGVSNNNSDLDIIGFCVPSLEHIFPHIKGEIFGFGSQKQRFEQYQQHHIFDKNANGGNGQNYDITIFNIIKYFQLLMENNPNIIDSIFSPLNCITQMSMIGTIVRDNRRLFLHKGCWFKFKGYSYSQLHKAGNKSTIKLVEFCKEKNITTELTYDEVHDHYLNSTINQKIEKLENTELVNLLEILKPYKNVKMSKRLNTVEETGGDFKFLYHVVRLLLEAEQILMEGDLDLQRNNELLKAIRRGERDLPWVIDFFTQKEKQLDELYIKSDLRIKPDESSIKQILLNCLEEHFGNLDIIRKSPVINEVNASKVLSEIKEVLEKNGY